MARYAENLPLSAGTPRNAPLRIIHFCGAPQKSEVGSAWPKTTDDDRDFLSLTFDFPGLAAPVYAILIKDLEGDGYSAYWSRNKKPVFE